MKPDIVSIDAYERDSYRDADYDGKMPGASAPAPRIRLVPFDLIKMGRDRRYLVQKLIPRVGLTVVWGPPKSGKSFWTFDIVMHVALGWEYRGRRVQQGPVVYCAFEGQTGLETRVEAFRQRCLQEDVGDVPFFLEPVTLDLVGDYKELIATIRRQMTVEPVVVVLDTLNRSLRGSESNDQDMSAYVRAADAIREAFNCAVIVVHHCGIDGSRPRGHTSLTGAADAQLSVKRDAADNVIVTLECAKDGPEGETLASKLESVEVGTDEDGEAITSCVITIADAAPTYEDAGPRLTKNQATVYSLLRDAGPAGLPLEIWNERSREAGIGTSRKADLYDIRKALQSKALIFEGKAGWFAK